MFHSGWPCGLLGAFLLSLHLLRWFWLHKEILPTSSILPIKKNAKDINRVAVKRCVWLQVMEPATELFKAQGILSKKPKEKLLPDVTKQGWYLYSTCRLFSCLQGFCHSPSHCVYNPIGGRRKGRDVRWTLETHWLSHMATPNHEKVWAGELRAVHFLEQRKHSWERLGTCVQWTNLEYLPQGSP